MRVGGDVASKTSHELLTDPSQTRFKGSNINIIIIYNIMIRIYVSVTAVFFQQHKWKWSVITWLPVNNETYRGRIIVYILLVLFLYKM